MGHRVKDDAFITAQTAYIEQALADLHQTQSAEVIVIGAAAPVPFARVAAFQEARLALMQWIAGATVEEIEARLVEAQAVLDAAERPLVEYRSTVELLQHALREES